jgi:hypothetical protein
MGHLTIVTPFSGLSQSLALLLLLRVLLPISMPTIKPRPRMSMMGYLL